MVPTITPAACVIVLIWGIRGDLTVPERKAYIAAVQCILATKPKIDAKKVPGARSRYDDFVAIHIQQTLTIHGTVSPS